MRHIKYLLFVLALVTGVGHAEAQSTRSALTLVNDSLFTTNGVGAITGKTANGWNQQILASFGSLTDANSWAGSNVFLGAVTLAGTGYTYSNGPGSPVTFSLFVPTGSLSGTLQAAQEPAHTGDCTNSAGSLATTCTKTNGVAFTAAATTAIGTSGATIPLLNGANTWGAPQVLPWTSGGAGASAQTVSSKIAQTVSTADFGADVTGAADSASAFSSAISTAGIGGTVNVPKGIYALTSNPAPGFPAESFNVAVGTTWQGNGAGGLGVGSYGAPPFGHPYTNPYNTTSGPMFYCSGLTTPAAPSGNVTECYSQEFLLPSTGMARQLLAYMGVDDNSNVTNGAWAEDINIVENVHKADLMGATSTRVPFEIDLNVDASTSGASIASDTGITGILIAGGGAGGPYQPGLAGTGINIVRSTGAWNRAYYAWNSQDGLSTNTYRHGLLMASTYWGNATDPYCPSGSHPSGCTPQNGILMDNAPYWSGTVLAAGQLANANDTIVLGRATDTSPTGSFLNFVNHANSQQLFNVNTLGQATISPSTGSNAQLTLNAPSGSAAIAQLSYNGAYTGSVGASSASNLYLYDNVNSANVLNVAPSGGVTVGNASKPLTLQGSSVTVSGITGTLPVYSNTGTLYNGMHVVTGTVALSAGSGTVTLSGSAAYTGAATFTCVMTDTTNLNPVETWNGSSTLINIRGTGTDTIAYHCIGN